MTSSKVTNSNEESSLIRTYFYKVLRSPMFYLSIVAVMALCFITNRMAGAILGDVANVLNYFLSVDTMRKLIPIFSALPFAANFADEWNNRASISYITRSGVVKYGIANAVICFVSSLSVVFIAFMLYCFCWSFVLPVYKPDNNPADAFYATMLKGGAPWLFIIFRSLIFASSCALWNMMGMLLTAFFPNKYVGICAPFVASYVVERATIWLPVYFNLWYASLARIPFNNAWGITFYCLGLFTVLSAICGFAFVLLVKRRVQNENS